MKRHPGQGIPCPNLPGARLRVPGHRWWVATHPCIFQTDDLENLLRPDENPWAFEHNANKRAQAYHEQTGRHFGFFANNEPVRCVNGMIQGKFEVSVERWLKTQGLPVPAAGTFPMRAKLPHRRKAEPTAWRILNAYQCLGGLSA